jgi:hypothetical protein
MQTQTRSVALPQPAEAANEELLPLPDAAESFGWDAHEVWRTRIKAVRDARVSLSPVARETRGSWKDRSRYKGFHRWPASLRRLTLVLFGR